MQFISELLQQGNISPENAISQAESHLTALRNLPTDTDGRDDEIAKTEKFIAQTRERL